MDRGCRSVKIGGARRGATSVVAISLLEPKRSLTIDAGPRVRGRGRGSVPTGGPSSPPLVSGGRWRLARGGLPSRSLTAEENIMDRRELLSALGAGAAGLVAMGGGVARAQE